MSTVASLLAAAEIAWRSARATDARELYQQILAIDSDQSLALRRLAWLEDDRGDTHSAIALTRRLIARHPADARAHQDLGLCLRKIGASEEALRQLRRATDVDPTYAPAFCNLGLALEDAGDLPGAAAALHRAAQLRPDSAFIAYHLAAVGGARPPGACPPDYLVRLFDDYADRFDAHLFQTLSYRGPALLAEIVSEHGRRKPWDIIDLGCGTGMTAVPFCSAARTIIGVDLAGRMLQRAGQRTLPDGRRVYDSLLQCDIVAGLNQRPASSDLILAADVFIYVGDLRPVFLAARNALRPGGLFAFTIEVFAGPGDFQLNATRRYAQNPQYITRLAGEFHLSILDNRAEFLRHGENGLPVEGNVYLLRLDSSG